MILLKSFQYENGTPHEIASWEISRDFLERYKFNKDEIETVSNEDNSLNKETEVTSDNEIVNDTDVENKSETKKL